MVKHLTLSILILSLLSGCGFIRSVWYASPPARKNVTISGKELPSFTQVFSENTSEAESTLQIWKESVSSSFGKIEGEHPHYLRREEIKKLILAGFLKLDTDPNTSVQKAFGVLEILGYKDGISLNNVKELFDWLRTNRLQAKAFYQTFLDSNSKPEDFKSSELLKAIQFFGSLFALTGDQAISSSHLSELLLPWIPQNYTHARNALPSGIELGVAFFASLCGDRVDPSDWNGKRIGGCLNTLGETFSKDSIAFDFMFGRANPTENRASLKTAALSLPNEVKNWVSGHHHPAFPIAKVKEFSNALDIPAPYAFVELTSWMPKLNHDSSPEALSPSFFIDLSNTVSTWITTTVDQTSQEVCDLPNWKECEFHGTEYDPVNKLFNAEYATLIRKKTLGFLSKIALYDNLSSFMLNKMELNEKGEVDQSIKDLINIVIRLLDTNNYAQSVILRVMERPFDPSTTKDSLKEIDRQGLSELAALAADLIPARADDQSFLKRLEGSVGLGTGRVSYSLDQVGVTTFLYLYDLIGTLRLDFMANYGLNKDPITKIAGPLTYVGREEIVQQLPRMLHDHFPNIYQECVEHGFERTCGTVYTELLPNAKYFPNKINPTHIEAYEMDVITLTSILLESMMNRCDVNNDQKFTYNHGFDEKRCMVNVSTALVKRLINAKIVKKKAIIEDLITLTHNVPFVTWAAKKALSKGTIKNITTWGLPPFSLFSSPASLGTMLSLAAEFMASDKVEAIENETDGPVSNPGEELVYHHRLTKDWLPKATDEKRSP